MYETSLTLAWALQVPPVCFGSHFEAYVELRPIINMLRLCNRFGVGERAAITKIPVELLQRVEEYLLEGVRQEKHEEWETEFKCWEGRCEPLDHLEDAEMLELYNTIKPVMMGETPPNELVDEINEEVREFVSEEIDIFGEECWYELHDIRRDGWFERVGFPSQPHQLDIADWATVLEADFGLNIWIGHTQDESKSNDYHEGDYVGSTQIFLLLPDAWSAAEGWAPSIMSSAYRAEGEASLVLDPVIPPRPSTKSLSRFSRALKILKLQAVGAPVVKKREDDEARNSSAGTSADDVHPKLKLFVVSSDGASD